MGYTHYWKHKRRFTNPQWAEVKDDIAAILMQAKDEGIVIADGMGEAELAPILDGMTNTYDDIKGEVIQFNGLGDDMCETVNIYQNRRPLDEWQEKARYGCDFTKTNRNSYDTALTAVLCYLESVYPEHFECDSDGSLTDWTAGLELARRALPTKTNMLQEPFDVRYDSQFEYARTPLTFCEKYDLRLRTNGEWLFFNRNKPYQPIAYVPTQHATAFVEEMEKRCATLPRSTMAAGSNKELYRKHDNAARDLMTYCIVVEGTPDGLTVPH